MTDIGNMRREIVSIDLGDRSYDIVIGSQLLEQAAEFLHPYISNRHVVVVTDPVVKDKYLPRLAPALDEIASRWGSCLIPAGETSKSIPEAQNLIEGLLDQGADRKSVVIALGGGVVGDVAGFAASVLMRGVDFIQMPTTFMSQIDSAVGGKNSINTRHGKNLIGTFHQPRIVLNDIDLLQTLPERELRNGYGEMVKYGLLRGEQEFGWLENNSDKVLALDQDALIDAVRMGCETKGHIVTIDERDHGDRAFVNLGHTFAHAIEAEAGFGDLLHGEALAAGLVAATSLSHQAGFIDEELVHRVRRHIQDVGLPDRIASLPSDHVWSAQSILDRMAYDKKTVAGQIHFVLLRGVGHPVVVPDIPNQTVLDVLNNECAS